MSEPTVAQHLATRFADDARALRSRADAIAKAPPPRGAGPDAAACRAMADACDRVRALFEAAPDEAAVRAALPTLAGLLAGARSDHERHVYAGAVARANDALDGDADEDDDEDMEDDDA